MFFKKLGLAYQWSFGVTWIHPFLYMFLYRPKKIKNYSGQCHKKSHLDLDRLYKKNINNNFYCAVKSTCVIFLVFNLNNH